MFLANIERVVLVLLEMHATIAYSVSHLRDPLKQILHRYLKHIDTGEVSYLANSIDCYRFVVS